jgi:hypothetical protein
VLSLRLLLSRGPLLLHRLCLGRRLRMFVSFAGDRFRSGRCGVIAGLLLLPHKKLLLLR